MDILGKLIVDNIVQWSIATIIIVPIAGYLYLEVRKYIKTQKENMFKQTALINDPNIRKLVQDIILNIEASIGSESGQVKFEKAKAQILMKVPDILDPLVGELLQGVYDELKAKSKIE